MLTEERFAKILSILESMGSVTVQQLMTELNASESTIRRDLNALDANAGVPGSAWVIISSISR